MVTRLLDFIRRLCFDRLLNVAAGWRLRLRQLAFAEDVEKIKKLQDSLGTALRIKIIFSSEGAFLPFEWSAGVDESTVLKGTFQKEVVIQDNFAPGKVLTFDKRHIRYLPDGVDWPAILSEVRRGNS